MSRASYEGDSRLIIWALAWDAHAVTNGVSLFDANLYFPEAGALRFNEHFLGIALVALPFQWIDGPVFAYWAVWLLAFPLNAVAMYALAWHVTRDRSGAFLAGLVYAFCFFRMHHAHGHLQLLWTWPLPLIPLAVERWLAGSALAAGQRPRFRDTAALTGLLLFQSLVSWYLAVLAALVAVVSLGVMVPGRRLTGRHLAHAAVAGVVALPLLAWLAAPYFSLQPAGAAEAAGLSADVKGYLMPPLNTWLGQVLPASWAPREIWGERTVYIGWTTLLLAGAGAVAVGRRWRSSAAEPGSRSRPASRTMIAVIVAGLLALSISFGPASGWSPYDLLSQLPGFSLLRAPARMALLVMMALSLLAAFGAAAIRSKAICAIAGVLILAEAYVVGFPSGKPQAFLMPPVYARLAELPPGPVLSLPTYRATPESFRDADYLYFSTAHWNPIVNGYGRQEPPAHGAFMEAARRFPAPDALAWLRQAGVRYVVMNDRRASELRPAIAAARSTPGVTVIAESDGDVLFDVGS